MGGLDLQENLRVNAGYVYHPLKNQKRCRVAQIRTLNPKRVMNYFVLGD
ncbi:unnamed protein product [Pocillopora meandrina]|uniref:Uncharacterized protein n=1 Tax=Pocillopora meandrina TaxID=46732 RepID=A0AAU9VMR2_9CNID|nr:unnamed protein product [Pocillopora meandrina]